MTRNTQRSLVDRDGDLVDPRTAAVGADPQTAEVDGDMDAVRIPVLNEPAVLLVEPGRFGEDALYVRWIPRQGHVADECQIFLDIVPRERSRADGVSRNYFVLKHDYSLDRGVS